MNKRIDPVQCAAVVVMLAIGLAVLWVLFPALKTAAAAEWVGAIGTILAFAGTIVIAGTETRRRKMHETTMGKLAAAGLVNRVVTAKINVERAIQDLEGWAGWFGDYEVIAHNLMRDELWTNDELVLLVPLHENCAHKLSAAKANIDSIVRLMLGAKTNPKAQNALDEFYQYTVDALKETYGQLTSTAEICQEECARLVSVD